MLVSQLFLPSNHWYTMVPCHNLFGHVHSPITLMLVCGCINRASNMLKGSTQLVPTRPEWRYLNRLHGNALTLNAFMRTCRVRALTIALLDWLPTLAILIGTFTNKRAPHTTIKPLHQLCHPSWPIVLTKDSKRLKVRFVSFLHTAYDSTLVRLTAH